MAIVLWVLAGLVLILLLAGAYVFFKACVRRREIPWMVEEELKKTSAGQKFLKKY